MTPGGLVGLVVGKVHVTVTAERAAISRAASVNTAAAAAAVRSTSASCCYFHFHTCTSGGHGCCYFHICASGGGLSLTRPAALPWDMQPIAPCSSGCVMYRVHRARPSWPGHLSGSSGPGCSPGKAPAAASLSSGGVQYNSQLPECNSQCNSHTGQKKCHH